MAGKKVLIIYAHQEPKSLNGSLKNLAVEELSKQGCSVTVSDLYTMQFEPRATRNDITGFLHNSEHFNYGVESWEAYKRRCLASDLTEEQRKVQEAELVIFQFPLYWFSMPAIMKGWVDRVLVQGFAYYGKLYYDNGLLKDKLALLSFTTGGDEEMFSKGGVNGDIRYLLWPMQPSTFASVPYNQASMSRHHGFLRVPRKLWVGCIVWLNHSKAWYNALLWFQSPCSSDLLCSRVCDRKEEKGDVGLLGTATEDYLGGKAYKLHS